MFGTILKGRIWFTPGNVEKPQDPSKKNNEELPLFISEQKEREQG